MSCGSVCCGICSCTSCLVCSNCCVWSTCCVSCAAVVVVVVSSTISCGASSSTGSGSSNCFTNVLANGRGINCIISESINSPTFKLKRTLTNTSPSAFPTTSSNLSISLYSTKGGEISTRLLNTVDMLVAEAPIIWFIASCTALNSISDNSFFGFKPSPPSIMSEITAASTASSRICFLHQSHPYNLLVN